jgi:hypothetical protein
MVRLLVLHIPSQNSQFTLWTGRFVPQRPHLFATSGLDGTIHLYKTYDLLYLCVPVPSTPYAPSGTSSIDLVHKSEQSQQPVIWFDWNANKEGLCLFTSFDQTVKVGYFPNLV